MYITVYFDKRGVERGVPSGCSAVGVPARLANCAEAWPPV
jgi:hypothetical protein